MTESMAKTFKLAIAAIIKDEARFLPEWIEYHRLIGVEHFFVFNNNSSDDIHLVLRKYINYGLVTLVEWPFHPGQVYAYSYATRVFGPLVDWMALIDIDEFISMPSGETLSNFLDTLQNVDQILIPWAMFGSSGHVSVPSGLVIENYVQRAVRPSHMVKSIVRPEAVTQAEVHQSRTRRGLTVNEKLDKIPEVWRQKDSSFEIIRINHYYVKSEADWAAKIRRGDAANNVRTMEDFRKNDYNEVTDNSLADLAQELKKRLRDFADLPDTPFGYAPFSKLAEISTVREWFVAAHKAAEKIQHTACEPSDWTCAFLTDRAVVSTPRIGIDLTQYFDDATDQLANHVGGDCIGAWDPGPTIGLHELSFSRLIPGRIFVAGALTVDGTDVLTVNVKGPEADGFGTARLNINAGTTFFILAVTPGALACGTISVSTTGLPKESPVVSHLRAFAYT